MAGRVCLIKEGEVYQPDLERLLEVDSADFINDKVPSKRIEEQRKLSVVNK